MEGIKSMSKQEMAQGYGVHLRTLNKWIKRANIVPNLITAEVYNRIKVFTPNEVKVIFEKIGEP